MTDNLSLSHIEHLQDTVARLIQQSPSTQTDTQLAICIPLIWSRAGDVLNYHHLLVGKYVDIYCKRKLWTRSGYESFKEAWGAEGIPDVSYHAVKGWQYAYQCQQLAQLPDEVAAIQPIGKLISAKPILERAAEDGELDILPSMLVDLKDVEVSQEMWLDRYGARKEGGEVRDRATIHSESGRIIYWLNEDQSRGLGIPMGVAATDADAEWAWHRVMSREVKLEWT